MRILRHLAWATGLVIFLAVAWTALFMWAADHVILEAEAQAACPNPNPNNTAWTSLSGPLFQGTDSPTPVSCNLTASGLNGAIATLANAIISINTSLSLLPATYVGRVSNNAALEALSGMSAGTAVYRAGFSNSGDGGAAYYVYSATNCSLNAGAGDNGSQVEASGSGCWNADFNAIPPNLRQWGAKGDCATNDSAAIQAAGNTGLTVRVPQGDFLIGTSITFANNNPPHFIGEGWNELGLSQYPTATSGCTTADGSYFSIVNTSVSPFTISSPQGSGNPTFENLAVLEKQPAVTSGWTPNVYPPIWTLDGSTVPMTGAKFFKIGLGAVYDAVYAKGNAARVQMSTLYGQVFGRVFRVEDALDVSKADDWHIWPFWSSDPNVLNWQNANSITFLFGRQDSFQADNIFAFGEKSCVQLSQWTTGPTPGPPTAIHFGNLNCDSAKYPVWVDSTSVSPVAAIDHFWVGGETIAGTPITGGNAIQIDGQNALIEINDINIIGVNQSVVNVTNVTFGSQVRIGSITAGPNGWNWNGSSYYSGTSPVINDASPSGFHSEFSILNPIQPQNAGQSAGGGSSSGIINSNSNALLYMATQDQAWNSSGITNGTTYVWPTWASVSILSPTGGAISTGTVQLPNLLDGTNLKLICNGSIGTLTITGPGAFTIAPHSAACSAQGKEITFKYTIAISPPTIWVTQ